MLNVKQWFSKLFSANPRSQPPGAPASGDAGKLFTPAYVYLMLVSLITALGYSMIATLISPYAVNAGAGLGLAGTLGGIYSLAALAVRPVGGLAADRLNKKKLCLVFTLLISLSMAGYAIAPNIPALFVVRILHGAAFGISGTVNIALVSECIPAKRLGEGLGYYGLGQVISQVVGPSMGVYVRDLWGYRALFLLIAAFTLIAVVILLCMKYTPPATEKKPAEKPSSIFRLKNLIALDCLVYALAGGMFSLGNGIVNAFLLLIGEERSIPGISLFFSVSAVVLFLGRLIMGRMADKKSLTLVTNLSLTLTVASMLLVGWAGSLPLMLVSAVLKAVGQGGGQISLQSACIKKAGPGRVGVATSTYYIGADIGQGFGPMLGGYLSAEIGYGGMFVVMAGIMVLFMMIFNLYQWRQSKKEQPA